MNLTEHGMWEILVPTEKRVKSPVPSRLDYGSDAAYEYALNKWERSNAYSTRYHHVWDAKVRELSGGLTILTPAKGQWVSPEGDLYRERMIPVRIMATRAQIEQIVDMTLEYYDQLAVLCYKISNEVILKERK